MNLHLTITQNILLVIFSGALAKKKQVGAFVLNFIFVTTIGLPLPGTNNCCPTCRKALALKAVKKLTSV
jgi:hypothetical protein